MSALKVATATPELLADGGTSSFGMRLLVLMVVVVFVGIPAAITWLKGQRAAFIVGFFTVGFVWYVGASRLAKPMSWWARRFYGPRKLERALQRFGHC